METHSRLDFLLGKFFKTPCGETVEAEKKVFHIQQRVNSCGGNVKESVENFLAKKNMEQSVPDQNTWPGKREKSSRNPPPAPSRSCGGDQRGNRRLFQSFSGSKKLGTQRSRMFLMISSTMALVWGSFFRSFSTWRMAYTTVEWSRPPKVWPISTMDI